MGSASAGWRGRLGRVGAAVLLWGAGAAAAAEAPLRLEAIDADAGRPVLCLGVQPGQEFEVEFLHSYDRFPFREFYAVLGPGRIGTTRMVFRSVLNGQGYVYAGLRVEKDGWAVIDGIGAEGPRVEFLMGSPDYANHRLRLGGVTHALAQWIEPGSLVHLAVRAGPCPPDPSGLEGVEHVQRRK